MSRMRQRVPSRLKDAQNTAAMLTTFQEVDMENLVNTRSKYKVAFMEKHGFLALYEENISKWGIWT